MTMRAARSGDPDCVSRRRRRSPGHGQAAAFRSTVEAVEVDVAVTRGGKTVAGLAADNFVVTDNGVVQDVKTALLAAEPLRLTLVLDLSKSVSGSRLASLIKASRAMVHALRPEDQASLITFSHRVTSVVPMGHDRSAINEALTMLSSGRRYRASRCAYLGLATASDDHSRALLLLFSDGLDTASFLTEDTVLEAAKHSNAVVHAVHFGRTPSSAASCRLPADRAGRRSPIGSWKSCSAACWTKCGPVTVDLLAVRAAEARMAPDQGVVEGRPRRRDREAGLLCSALNSLQRIPRCRAP